MQRFISISRTGQHCDLRSPPSKTSLLLWSWYKIQMETLSRINWIWTFHQWNRYLRLCIRFQWKVQQNVVKYHLQFHQCETWTCEYTHFNRMISEKRINIYLPMQFLGPIPNGTYEPGTILRLFSSLKRSGSNCSGAGKYFGSWCSA